MNKSIITHGVWIAVAAGAFAGGMAIKRDDAPASAGRDVNINVSGGGALSAMPGGKSANTGSENGNASATAPGASSSATQRSSSALVADYLTSNDPLEQNFLFAQLLMGMNAENAQEIYDSLKDNLSGRDGGRQMTLLFQAWGKIDGAAAIAAATEGAGEGGRGRGGPGGGDWNIGSVLSGWAATDSEAAKQWLATVEDEGQRSRYTFGLVNGMAKADPDGATAYVLELAAARAANADPEADGAQGRGRGGPWGGGDMTSRYIEMIASEQIKQGTSAATAWADALPDGDLKSSAFDQLAESLVRDDIDSAKSWIADYADQDYAQRAVREVAEQLSREDPKSALEWGDTLPVEAQASTYAEAMGRWTRESAEEASKYLATMENSPARDAAVSSFASALAFERDNEKRDPESAATWAATIEDEAKRTETLAGVARVWARDDKAAVTAWLPTSGLPQETQAQILATPDRGGADFGGGRGGRGGR